MVGNGLRDHFTLNALFQCTRILISGLSTDLHVYIFKEFLLLSVLIQQLSDSMGSI